MSKSAFELFKPSKDAVLNNLGPFLVLIFLPAFLSVVGDAVNGGSSIEFNNLFKFFQQQDNVNGFHAIGGLLALLLLPAGYYLEIQTAKGEKPSLGETFNGSMPYFWRILGLVLVMVVIIVLGLLAFIIPGLIFIRRYFLAPFFMIDRDLGIRESLSASAKASKTKPGAIWGVIGVVVLLSLFGIIPILGGLISSLLLMLYTCAPAYRYLELSHLDHSPERAQSKDTTQEPAA